MIDVKIDAFIPSDYIPQPSQKIAVYQQLASARQRVRGHRDRGRRRAIVLAAAQAPRKSRRSHDAAHVALQKGVTRVVVDERRLTFGVGSAFAIDPGAIPKLQSLTKNRFRFGDGKNHGRFPGRDRDARRRAAAGALAARGALADIKTA